MADSKTTINAANGLVLAATEGGVVSLYPLQGEQKGIGVYLPNGVTVNLGPLSVAQIHQFFGAWLEKVMADPDTTDTARV